MTKSKKKFLCRTLGLATCLSVGIASVATTTWAQTANNEEGSADSPSASGGTQSSPESEGAVNAGSSPSPATDATEARPAVEDSDQALKLRDLEERVNDLKERIFRSKARLILLRETVLNGVISGAKAAIVHRNEMGASFSLKQATYSLDGAPLYNKTDADGDLDDREEIELFNGSIVPGNHNLSVYLVYQGNGYGIFSYLKGYTFKIKSSYAFTAEEGKLTTVKAVAYEKGGFTTDLKDRPAIRYDVEVKQDAARPGVSPEGESQRGGAGAQTSSDGSDSE